MGTGDSLEALASDALREFKHHFHTQGSLVVSLVSPFRSAEVAEMCAEQFHLPRARELETPSSSFIPGVGQLFIERDVTQVHAAVTFPGVATHDPRRTAVMLIETLLARGVGSRLYRALREESGLVYDVRATHADYRDVGLFDITFGTSPNAAREVEKRIRTTVADLCETLVTDAELDRAKHVLRSALRLSEAHNAHTAKRAAHDYAFIGAVQTTAETERLIEAVTRDELRATARALFGGATQTVYLARKPVLG
jgi:predicted Zn-dependent peptidase